ncbi:flagellar basal body-associated protein FliL [Gallaecimonas sp. GXIMD4217]|uniref:flagellar basal body-associated protein FliL n=1 Tax=Gallaecimonas sp. GXIMD4217 TaxID=3131927 RepID=UPI00311AE1D7
MALPLRLMLLFSLLLPIPALAADPQPPSPSTSYFELEPDIITNYLSSARRMGYVRVTVQLRVRDAKGLTQVEHHAPLIRDAIVNILGSKEAQEIKSLTGREEIRLACLRQVKDLMTEETGEPVVEDVIFTKYLYY